jgi:hypothetical protein
MIVVIADDLTGAAEVAGAAYDAGYRAEVQLEFDPCSSAQVIVVDTDTRWRQPVEAAERLKHVLLTIGTPLPTRLFKKVDSVLRGPVWAELNAMLAVSGRRRAFLIPANPTRQRIIRHGQIWVANQPLAQSVLGQDPEYPRTSSFIPDVLGCSAAELTLLPNPRLLDRETGVLVPDVSTTADLQAWTRSIDQDTLAVGGVEFFQAWLRCLEPGPHAGPDAETIMGAVPQSCVKRNAVGPSPISTENASVPASPVPRETASSNANRSPVRHAATSPPSGSNSEPTADSAGKAKPDNSGLFNEARDPLITQAGACESRDAIPSIARTLFVCGSAAAWCLRREQAKSSHLPVVTVPEELFDPALPIPFEPWLAKIAFQWQTTPRLMIAIGDAPSSAPIAPRTLVTRFARLVVAILQRFHVECLCLEGGATAAAVLQHEAASRFCVTHTYGPGIVELTVPGRADPRRIVKPGSYPWPDAVWQPDHHPTR